MDKPLRGIGLHLGLRLYLLLLAVALPVVSLYTFGHLRALDALHDEEVGVAARACALRIQDRLEAIAAAPAPEGGLEADIARGSLEEYLARVLAAQPGLESAAAYGRDDRGGLKLLAGAGLGAPMRPTETDLDAASLGQTRRIEVLRGERRLEAFSFPIPPAAGGDARGALHLEVAPEKIGLGPRLALLRFAPLAGAVLLLVAIGVLLFFFFRLAAGRPVRRLIDAMDRAAGGDLGAVVDIPAGEFGLLARSYNQMMNRLRASGEENRRLLGQIRDFSDRLQEKIDAATRELASKNDQLQEANERLFLLQRQLTTLEKLATLGQIAAVIAHELGTPLNAISGHLQLLLQDAVADPKLLDRLKVIDTQVDRLTGIVRDVLKAMRVPPPRLDRVRIGPVLREVADLFAPVARKRGVAVDLKLEEDVPPIQADADQLEQVFMNLFTNAIDAMPGGGRLAVSSAYVGADEAARLSRESWLSLGGGSYLRVDVADTGAGMDEETARRIFEPFFTTKREGAEPAAAGGLGLGLSICRQIVKNHQGEIAVRSEPGKGTAFAIYLPVEPSRVGV